MKQISEKQIKELIKLINEEQGEKAIKILEILEDDIKNKIRKLIRNCGKSNFMDKEILEEVIGDY